MAFLRSICMLWEMIILQTHTSLHTRIKSLMAKWVEQASQWHEMYCHDLEVMSSNPSWVKLRVLGTSVLSRTWIKNIQVHIIYHLSNKNQQWNKKCSYIIISDVHNLYKVVLLNMLMYSISSNICTNDAFYNICTNDAFYIWKARRGNSAEGRGLKSI